LDHYTLKDTTWLSDDAVTERMN